MSGQSANHFSTPSHGSSSALLQDIANDISKLIFDIFKLLGTHGCHPPCYCPGTMILTTEGERAVETLRVGDTVVTASGQSREILWVGRRDFNIETHAAPTSVRPVRIQAGAFGKNLPRRDLVVSPGHALFVDDVLIPARFLINGATIRQDLDAKTVTYFHVELESHDVLLAEGLPAESYLDTGNRGDFENGGQVVALFPSVEPKDWSDTCAPLLKSGPTVESVKRNLIEQASAFGYAVTDQHGLHIVAGGKAIEPTVEGDLYRFTLPDNCSNIRLASRSWVPAHMVPGSEDDRRLGVCVAEIEVDGKALSLDDMGSGWHRFDVSGDATYRWTTGSAELPGQARSIAVRLCGSALYWMDDLSNESGLREAA